MAKAVVLTGNVAAAYLGTWMSAANAGVGVDANRLAADAIAAQQGDKAARVRLVRPMFRLRPQPLVRHGARPPRSRRRRSASRRITRRARAPGRDGDGPQPVTDSRRLPPNLYLP